MYNKQTNLKDSVLQTNLMALLNNIIFYKLKSERMCPDVMCLFYFERLFYFLQCPFIVLLADFKKFLVIY